MLLTVGTGRRRLKSKTTGDVWQRRFKKVLERRAKSKKKKFTGQIVLNIVFVFGQFAVESSVAACAKNTRWNRTWTGTGSPMPTVSGVKSAQSPLYAADFNRCFASYLPKFAMWFFTRLPKKVFLSAVPTSHASTTSPSRLQGYFVNYTLEISNKDNRVMKKIANSKKRLLDNMHVSRVTVRVIKFEHSMENSV